MKKNRDKWETLTRVYIAVKGTEYVVDGGSEYVTSSGWESYLLQREADKLDKQAFKLGFRFRRRNR